MTKAEIKKKLKELNEEVSKISKAHNHTLSDELLAKLEPLYKQMELLEKQLNN